MAAGLVSLLRLKLKGFLLADRLILKTSFFLNRMRFGSALKKKEALMAGNPE